MELLAREINIFLATRFTTKGKKQMTKKKFSYDLIKSQNNSSDYASLKFDILFIKDFERDND